MTDHFEVMLEAENSRPTAVRIRDIVCADAPRIDELMQLFFSEDLRMCQRASWPLTLIAEREAGLVYPYVEQMLDNLAHPHHDAVIRNTFRAFQFIEFPDDVEGSVFDIAFNYLLDIDNAIAIRVFAMTVCGNIARRYPELSTELIPVIEEHLPHGSAGFRARGKQILKQLKIQD